MTVSRKDKIGNDQTAAQLLVRSLDQQQVKYIFGIPGGKIMPVFDVLNDEGPQLILCRHEQNAAFMAAAVGRLTGRPGVCLVTSGPGATLPRCDLPQTPPLPQSTSALNPPVTHRFPRRGIIWAIGQWLHVVL
jgi:hypothetical protein